MQGSAPRPVHPYDDGNSLKILEATLSFLWLATPFSATVSLILVAVAIATNQWLHTSEKMPNPTYNGTGEMDFLSKLTVSGLWIFCFTNPGEREYHCNKIEYFSEEIYSPDPNDSSPAIPYAVKKSIIFIIMGSIFILIGYMSCLIGQCMDNRARYTLFSGVIFIQTGLVMLCGLVMYIAVFKSEVAGKLRPKSQLQPAAFEYIYGYSFIIYLIGLVFTKLSGISCVFLYIYRTQYKSRRKQLDYMKKSSMSLPEGSFSDTRGSSMLFPCERHPESSVNFNSALLYTKNNFLNEKNYFARRKRYIVPCSIHRHISQSKSLRDISIFYNLPPPPHITSYLSVDDLNNLKVLSREITKNTLSTTADTVSDELFDENYSIRYEDEFVPFEFDPPSFTDMNPRTSERRTFGMESLRKTTPV
ncbi:stargazin-like protein [Leptinotarsa decemlineata]|uniref:stargazin-like protein n=1 Tax=Leptinotarsa decemlineata TaxID=7539 RepID=UPI003D3069C0